MFRNYFISFLRFIGKHKSYTLNNILGLSLGMACAIVIYLWILDELSFDKFHTNYNQIYRFVQTQQHEDSEFKIAVTPALLPPTFKEIFPEIIETARFRPDITGVLVSTKDKKFYENKIAYADKEFFQIFSFRFVNGSSLNPFPGINSVLITEEIANKYFGNNNPIGQSLTLNEEEVCSVSGILEEIPANSHLQFDILCNFEMLKSNSYWYSESWADQNFYGYAMLREGADPKLLSEKFDQYMREEQNFTQTHFWLQPLKDVHLRSDFDIDLYAHSEPKYQYILIFSIVGIFILLIAVINYINLSTARSARRAFEVAMRKVHGATRSQLIRQFMGESFMLVILSYLIAMLMVELVLPNFNVFTRKEVSIYYTDPYIGLGMFVLILLTGLVAGGYPSLFLSSYKPAHILKGDIKTGPATFRRVLVILQFCSAIVMIISTGIVYRQILYIQNMKLGLEKDLILYCRINGDINKNFQSFKQELTTYPGIGNVTYCTALPTYTVASTNSVDWEGRDEETSMIIHQFVVDHDYIPAFKIQMLAGRNFNRAHPSDSNDFIVNEAAVLQMGLEDPVGKRFQLWNKEGKIIGVMKDFHYKSLHKKVEPLCIRLSRTASGYVFIKIRDQNVNSTIKQIEKIWDKHNPLFPADLKFIDREYEKLYTSEQKIRVLFTIFAILSIFLSCLGLYGLSAFMAEKRTKEIGIRKALGSDTWQIMMNFSRDTLKWILVANLIAWPVAWFYMNNWLQAFAYKTEINLWIFLAATVLVIIIAILSISYQVIRTTKINPAVALKHE